MWPVAEQFDVAQIRQEANYSGWLSGKTDGAEAAEKEGYYWILVWFLWKAGKTSANHNEQKHPFNVSQPIRAPTVIVPLSDAPVRFGVIGQMRPPSSLGQIDN